MELYQYQVEAIQGLEKAFIANLKSEELQARNSILLLPTGGGKTFVFCAIVARTIKKSKKALIITDRLELMSQANGSLAAFNLKPTFLKTLKRTDLSQNLYVSMVETIFRRLQNKVYFTASNPKKTHVDRLYKQRASKVKEASNKYKEWINAFDLIVIDEAHKGCFDKLFAYINQKTFVIGATATPWRIAPQKSLEDFYSNLVEGADIEELQNLRKLSNARYFGYKVDLSKVGTVAGEYDAEDLHRAYTEQKIYNGVVENYKLHCDGQKTLVFSASVKSSLQILQAFIDAGYPAKHIDADSEDRSDILAWYKVTDNAILCNVGILTTGFDDQPTKVIVIYRAIKESLPLYLQICGRGSRVTSTKDSFTILDFGANIKRFDFWHKKRPWSLKRKEKKEGSGVAPIKDCPECEALVPAQSKCCTECGTMFPEKTKKESEAPKVILQEIIDPRLLKNAKVEAEMGHHVSLEQRAAIMEMSHSQRIAYCKQLSIEKMAIVHEMNLKPALPASTMLYWIDDQADAEKLCKLVKYNSFYLKNGHPKWKNLIK